VIATTGKFRTQNPKLYGVFLAALKEATEFINADKKRAAEIYLKASGDKMPVDELTGILNDPAIRYTMQLEGIGSFVDFMAKTGILKSPPASWRDMFFPEALAGG
jgi:NitT/TauT family transport system substrate-binding protein